MIEYCMQKEKKMIVVDTIVPEITSNPETRDYKHNNKKLPLYGIVSLILVLIGCIIVSINFNSNNVSFAMPILISSVIVAREGMIVDIVRGTAILGLFLGIIFLLISLWPVIRFVTFIFV